MLWLAGIVGAMAVGAVSLIDFKGSNTDDQQDDISDADPDGGQAQNHEDQATVGDMIEQIAGIDHDAIADEGAIADDDDPDDLPDGGSVILGGAGNDLLFGQDAPETINGGFGDDTIEGNDGIDVLAGDEGADEIRGHNGDDKLTGGAGDDMLQGSAGNDVLAGDAGDDALQGGLDDDTLVGGEGADTLFGGWGDDVMSGVEFDDDGLDTDAGDFLNGGGGNDLIIAGGEDTVTLGDGEDSVLLGDWFAEGERVQITDWDAQQDNILLVFDEEEGDAPEITLEADPSATGTTHILLDGVQVAEVLNAENLGPEHITLLPLSAAQAAGFAPT